MRVRYEYAIFNAFAVIKAAIVGVLPGFCSEMAVNCAHVISLKTLKLRIVRVEVFTRVNLAKFIREIELKFGKVFS